MPKISLPKVIAAIGLTSVLTVLSFAIPKELLAQNSDQPREGLPGRRVGGGTRSGNTLDLVALLPQNNQGLTFSQTPTFLVYIPQTQKPEMGEFMLMDENEEIVYQTNFTTNGKSGIVSIAPAQTNPTKFLEIGKVYKWYFSIIRSPGDRSADAYVTGSIKRVQPNQDLDNQLKKASLVERAALYAANNFWYDAIATLAELRYSNPVDADVAAKWTQLLQSVNLDNIAQEPLVKSQVSAQ
ncbi:MAG TPA: DUF928 domain-containing protein [Oculatellaceae cyanobacterium]|jgi:hypothetical protein